MHAPEMHAPEIGAINRRQMSDSDFFVLDMRLAENFWRQK